MSVNAKMTAIAEAIRAKTGKTAALTLDQMVTEIEGITGGTEMFAAIGVTYSAGSTLTCTNVETGEILTANPKTEGNTQWVFAIPQVGTWTVTATDGANTSNKSVEIISEGQFESINLEYTCILFDGENGGDNTRITGGWESIDGNGTLVVGAEKLSFISNKAANRRGATTVNPIPLYGKSMLYALGGTTVEDVTDNYTLAIIKEKSNATSAVVGQARLIKGSTAKEISIPLEGLEPDVDYYVAIYNSSSSKESFITKCWAE
jgi:hypothetical protein